MWSTATCSAGAGCGRALRPGSAWNRRSSLTSAPLETQLSDAAPLWERIAQKYNLVEPELAALVSPWHTDADLGRPIEVVIDMSKSRKLGFFDYQATEDSFFNLFAALRQARVIP